MKPSQKAVHLVPLAEDLWEATTLLSFPGGVRLPARMTVVRKDGRLLLHSPLALTDELVDALRELGDVAAIVAPNRFHHRFLRGAMQHFPGAKVYGVPGLPEKRKDVAFTGVLNGATGEIDATFEDVLAPMALRGTPVLSEVAFYHRPSATFITADMVFNVREPATFSTKVALSTMGTRGRLAQSRFFHFYTRDKAAMRQSLAEVLAVAHQARRHGPRRGVRARGCAGTPA
jgi:hypothetical protein